ncbi:MAG: anthranilate phosphoribosyltransferase [Hyphomicrobiaceae bacterium]|nr:anthranilate phosphoribosyltransferase [Hyphomicrobiaceae bacterium]
MSSTTPLDLMTRAASGRAFSEVEIEAALDVLMTPAATDVQRGAFLMALRVRGETIAEITGAARALRARMLRVSAPAGAVDIVGTGGDSHGTYNISTAASIVAASAGLVVAKHGNRSVSSQSGASDVLTALGVKVDIGPDEVASAIATAGIGFMWAPMHHPAMKLWAPSRADLKIRTIFNVLGPICNPAGVSRQLVGVYDIGLVEPIAETLLKLGTERAWVVHGCDGMDELTTTGPTRVAALDDGAISVFDVTPEMAGLPTARLADLKGGDAASNAEALRDLLAGAPGPYRDIVLLNAGAALVIGDRAGSLADGAAIAASAIDSGAARRTLDKLITATHQKAP